MDHINNGNSESEDFLNQNSVAFADYFTTVNDVTNNAPLETWGNNGHECADAARKQMKNAGYEVTGNYSESNIYTKIDENYNPNNLEENVFGGAIRIMTDMKKGKPVMVGVAETNEAGGYALANNQNPISGHFIVIRSANVNKDGLLHLIILIMQSQQVKVQISI